LVTTACGRSDGIPVVGMRADEPRELVLRGGGRGTELLQVHGTHVIDVQIPVNGYDARVRNSRGGGVGNGRRRSVQAGWRRASERANERWVSDVSESRHLWAAEHRRIPKPAPAHIPSKTYTRNHGHAPQLLHAPCQRRMLVFQRHHEFPSVPNSRAGLFLKCLHLAHCRMFEQGVRVYPTCIKRIVRYDRQPIREQKFFHLSTTTRWIFALWRRIALHLILLHPSAYPGTLRSAPSIIAVPRA